MRKFKNQILFLFAFFVCIYSVNAKETQTSKDVKTALKSYAALPELKKRGFNFESIQSANTMHTVYKALLPYMIQDGISLDNAIELYDKSNGHRFNFKQHYSVHFTDDYGTREDLINKGYHENEILPYFSKGKDIYRGGKFFWEKLKEYPEINQSVMPRVPPITGDNFIYFWSMYYTEEFYPEYWEKASSKTNIIIDLRLNNGGDYPISCFFDFLDEIDYKGQVIIIIDASSYTGEFLLNNRMSKWQNGKEVPRKFRYTTIGENTLGFANYSGSWERAESERNIIWGIRTQINQWKKYEEGVGIMPDIWAENSEDIYKTVEILTDIKNFSKSITVYQNFINNWMMDYEKYSFAFPYLEKLYQLKDDNAFIENLSKYEEIKKRWYNFCLENKDKCPSIRGELITQYNSRLLNAEKTLPLEQYLAQLDKVVDDSILNARTYLGDFRKDKYVPDYKLSEKEIEKLYKELGISMVEIPGKDIQIMTTEVTQKLFERIMGYNPSTEKVSYRKETDNGREYKPVDNTGDNYPVCSVSWLEAVYFCNRLSRKFGFTPVYSVNGENNEEKWDYLPHHGSWGYDGIVQNKNANGFRLPTREEWVYAAKGGESYKYAGSDNLDEVGWYEGNSGYKLHPVAQKKPNGYGLYDMSGNLNEYIWETSAWGGSYDASAYLSMFHEANHNSKVTSVVSDGIRIVKSNYTVDQPEEKTISDSDTSVKKEKQQSAKKTKKKPLKAPSEKEIAKIAKKMKKKLAENKEETISSE